MATWSLLQPRATSGSVMTPEEFDFTLPVITLDANLTEKHTLKANISKYPIERSANGETRINDHIEMEPDSLSIQGVITNTPIDPANLVLQGIQSPSVVDRVNKTYDALERLMRAGTLFTVVTGLKTYTSMAISSIDTTRAGNPGYQDIRPMITFDKVHIVDTAVVPVPANILKKPPKTPDAPTPAPSSDTSGQTKQKLEKQAPENTFAKQAAKALADAFVAFGGG